MLFEFLVRADGGNRTHDPEITNHVLWPTELHRQNVLFFKRECKCITFYDTTNTLFMIFVRFLAKSLKFLQLSSQLLIEVRYQLVDFGISCRPACHEAHDAFCFASRSPHLEADVLLQSVYDVIRQSEELLVCRGVYLY